MVAKRRTSLRGRSCVAPTSRQATTSRLCTSSPQHRSKIASMSALLSRRAERSASSGQFDPRAAPDERANFWFDYADQVSFVGGVTVAPPVKDDLVSAPCPNATSLRGGSRRVSSFFLVALGHECFVVSSSGREGDSVNVRTNPVRGPSACQRLDATGPARPPGRVRDPGAAPSTAGADGRRRPHRDPRRWPPVGRRVRLDAARVGPQLPGLGRDAFLGDRLLLLALRALQHPGFDPAPPSRLL